MKKIISAILTMVMILSSFTFTAFAEDNMPEYTKTKVFTGTFGFGEAEITVLTNDDENVFDITFVCFDDPQELAGTVENGICTVEYDKVGFVGQDCQQIWDAALASENAWKPLATYTKQKVFTGTFGFGEAEITVLTNDDESVFDITFVCFDDPQELIGTVEDGICTVKYDRVGFVGQDCQQVWDAALASENAWEEPSAKEEAAIEDNSAEQYAIENIELIENAPLAGKKLIFLGSSVTYGIKTGISFVDYIAARNGCEVVKEAVSGTTLVTMDETSYIPRMETIDQEFEADAFICQLSTNDASGELPLGEISESVNREDFDTSTVAGAIEYIIGYAKDTWNCPVLFYTNPKYDNEQYAEMVLLLEDIAEKWDVKLINMWEDEEINSMVEADRANLLYDLIHPRPGFYLDVWTPMFESAIAEVIE